MRYDRLLLSLAFGVCAVAVPPRILQSETTWTQAATQVSVEVESDQPERILIVFEGRATPLHWTTKDPGTPFLAGKTFDLTGAGRHRLRFEFAGGADTLINRAKSRISIRTKTDSGWDPPLAAGEIIPLEPVKTELLEDSESRQIHSIQVEAKFATGGNSECSFFTQSGLASYGMMFQPGKVSEPGVQSWSGTLRIFKASANEEPSLAHLTVQVSGVKGMLSVPLERLQTIPLARLTSREDLLRTRVTEPNAEAGAGSSLRLAYVIEGSGEPTMLRPEPVLLDGKPIPFGHSGWVRPKWNVIQANLIVDIPSTTAPGEHIITTTANMFGQTKSPLEWKVKITEEATAGIRRVNREQATREAAEDIAFSTPFRALDTTERRPAEPEVTFQSEVRLRKIRLMLVLDASGSMNGKPGALLKPAVLRFARQFLDGRNELGIVVFDTFVRTVRGFSADWGEAAEQVNDIVRPLQYQGATNLTGALLAAENEFAKAPVDPSTVNVVLVFTDGFPNISRLEGLSACEWERFGRRPSGSIAASLSVLVVESGQVFDEDTRKQIAMGCQLPDPRGLPIDQSAAVVARLQASLGVRVAMLALWPAALRPDHAVSLDRLSQHNIKNTGGAAVQPEGIWVHVQTPEALAKEFQAMRQRILHWATDPRK
jgi:Mg-chelatase subunit ChlD